MKRVMMAQTVTLPMVVMTCVKSPATDSVVHKMVQDCMMRTIVEISSLAEVVDYAPPVVFQRLPTTPQDIPGHGTAMAPTAVQTIAVVHGRNGVEMR